MGNSTNPLIRLIMFTSDDCIYCPPIESIVQEVVGGTMSDFIYVNTVDVDENPDAAERYNITSLPTLMINEQIVLQGGMDDDSVREILWNTLLSLAVANKERLERSKKSLLHIAVNSWESLTGERMLRKTLGDFIHLGPYQLTLLSLYSLDPLVPSILYQAGYQLGLYGLMHHVLSVLEPRLGLTIQRQKRLKYITEALEYYYADREFLPTYVAESARIVSLKEDQFTIEIRGLASAAMGINVGEPMCDFTAGTLAGVTDSLMGSQSVAVETACAANGNPHCVFTVYIDHPNPQEIRKTPVVEDKLAIRERRLNFYESIHELSINLENSYFMRRRLRPTIGDVVHISVFQPIVLSIKMMDDYLSSILFSAGRELGIFGSGKTLLYDIIQTDESEEFSQLLPLEFNEGVDVLKEFMTHPTTYLAKEWGLVKVSPVDPANPNVRYISISDYGAVSGVPDLGITLCDFLAGFLTGRLSVIIGAEPMVREIECQGTGASSCKFEIVKPDNLPDSDS